MTQHDSTTTTRRIYREGIFIGRIRAGAVFDCTGRLRCGDAFEAFARSAATAAVIDLEPVTQPGGQVVWQVPA